MKKQVCSLAVIGLLMTDVSLAVDSYNFWLPSSYREWLPEMRQEAEALEKTEACVKVIKATLHESYSTRENPVFRFVCRDSQRVSFSILVDAITHKQTYSNPERSPEAIAARKAAAIEEARLAEIEAAKERLDASRQKCQQLLDKRTKFMRNLSWVSDGLSEPKRIDLEGKKKAKGKPKPESVKKAVSESEAVEDEVPQAWVFDAQFDASDLHNRPLRYQARCIVPDEGKVSLKISRRSEP
jgi:hypothetical protein